MGPPTKCATCGAPVSKGTKHFWADSNHRQAVKFYCVACGFMVALSGKS